MTIFRHFIVLMLGWGGGIRTPGCWYQKPVPYHLATPHGTPDDITYCGFSQEVGGAIFAQASHIEGRCQAYQS